MIKNWTLISRRLQDEINGSSILKAAFTAYSFVSLLFFAPAPALGSTRPAEIAPAVKIDISSTLFLPGGDPAAREIGDPLPSCLRDGSFASPLVDTKTWGAPGWRISDWLADGRLGVAMRMRELSDFQRSPNNLPASGIGLHFSISMESAT
jgi:hypothetical protein